jgi:hypothetical protein
LCFKDKAPAHYPRSLAEEIFLRGALASSDLVEVSYSDGYAMVDAEEEQIDHLVLEGFNGRTAIERLFEFADRTDGLISWPGSETSYAVTRAEVIQQIPDDFAEDGETIAVVTNVDEFIEVAEIVFP